MDEVGGVDPQPFQEKKISKSYLVVLDRPGKPISAEILTIVPTSNYVSKLELSQSTAPDLHIDNVFPTHQRLGNFEGSFRFHDLKGELLFEEKFINGEFVDYNLFENYISDFIPNPLPYVFPMQLASLCWDTYLYTRACGLDDDGNEIDCIYSVKFVRTTCIQLDFNNGGVVVTGGGDVTGDGAGGSGGGTRKKGRPGIYDIENKSPKSISCRTFQFTNGPGNWQEAGLKDYRFRVALIDPVTREINYRTIYINQTLYFGLPKEYGNGDILSGGGAAEKTAHAIVQAGFKTIDYYSNATLTTSNYEIERTFRNILVSEMRQFGGTVKATPTVLGVIVSRPKFNTFFADDCD